VSTSDDDRQRFAEMFDELSARVFAYARRQCDMTTAQDIVADTFLVAWRRFADLPDNPLPWLLVVARNTLANRRRRDLRYDQLIDAMSRLETLAGPAAGVEQSVVERDTLLAALGELTDLEREAVLLVAWDGLSGRDAAEVAGCSVRAFEVRLSRARARMTRALADTPITSTAAARKAR
jgi:RNA polymerase sigma factor (sigma-70 family)